ncbi:n-acetyltransferase domain-containing protein [Caerostris extrusa]|uniref:N-acetyltransferase domain-containing protein n=1 Tax=Caerostris extrusa TaxID=172846 RepID=A0AAV4RAU7_CAEEX|nr:n-acetyltransferase domain-containing protein [Caerostris extrusa]
MTSSIYQDILLDHPLKFVILTSIRRISPTSFGGLYAVKQSHRGKVLEFEYGKGNGAHRRKGNFRCSEFRKRNGEPEGIQIVQIRASVLPAVINYDASVHGYDRSKIVTLTTSEQDSYSLAAVRNGTRRVCGYGCLKSNVQGSLLVGPLYADRADIAEELLRRLFDEFPGEYNGKITVGVINCNSEAMELVKKLQLDIGQEVPRC